VTPAAAGSAPRPGSPAWAPRVRVGDRLLPGLISRDEYARVHPHLADLHGAAFPHRAFAWPTHPAP
jgi:hypothetical protein